LDSEKKEESGEKNIKSSRRRTLHRSDAFVVKEGRGQGRRRSFSKKINSFRAKMNPH